MGRPSLDQDADTFLEKLRRAGGGCGNYYLKSQLEWTDDRYWRTHSMVVDKGLVVRGRGRGGTILLVEQAPIIKDNADPNVTAADGEQLAAVYVKEAELYAPARRVIQDAWSREQSYDDFVVELTAQPGRVQTGGAWTRPDISLLGTKAYSYLPERFFEIVTFEVKTAESLDVRGVFEALSHAQFATLAYVVFYTDRKELKDYPNSERILELAAKHGVGVIAAGHIEKYETWTELVEPRRNVYNPEQANLFISTSFSENARSRIVKWHK